MIYFNTKLWNPKYKLSLKIIVYKYVKISNNIDKRFVNIIYTIFRSKITCWNKFKGSKQLKIQKEGKSTRWEHRGTHTVRSHGRVLSRVGRKLAHGMRHGCASSRGSPMKDLLHFQSRTRLMHTPKSQPVPVLDRSKLDVFPPFRILSQKYLLLTLDTS